MLGFSQLDCQSHDPNLAAQLAQSKYKMFYLDFPRDKNGVTVMTGAADLIAYDFERGKTVPLGYSTYSDREPVLSPNGHQFAFFADGFPHQGAFLLWDFVPRGESMIQTKVARYLLGDLGIRSMDYFNDSTIAFSIENSLYAVNIRNGATRTLLTIPDQLIDEFKCNRVRPLIALALTPLDSPLGPRTLAFYEPTLNKLSLTEKSCPFLENWSPDGKAFLYGCNWANADTVDAIIQHPELTERRYSRFTIGSSSASAVFLGRKDTMILLSYIEPSDFYIALISSGEIVSRITDNTRIKSTVGIFVKD